MKILQNSVLPFCLLLFFLNSCRQEENILPTQGNVAFSFSRENGISETAVPALVLFSIQDSKGGKLENIRLALYSSGENYVSENVKLQPGNYQLTQLLLLDAAYNVAYAMPMAGSDQSKFVTDPLPVGFIVKQEDSHVNPQVLAVSDVENAALFGYATFDFDVVSLSPVVLIKTGVTISIGGITYENVDAIISVKGYDAYNAMQWKRDYSFMGPVDVLEVRNGFHHYSIELVNKWGVNDIRTEIPAKEIWDGRADGPLPATYILGGSKDAKKLSRIVNSRQVDPIHTVGYPPESRVLYTYDGEGRLEYIHYETYNEQNSQFEETSSEAFIFDGTALSKITKTLNGEAYSEYKYEYGSENIVTEVILGGGIVTTQAITNNHNSNPADNSVTVNYSFSDGGSLLYQFETLNRNIASDKTVKSGQVCNEGVYTYDKNINPFRHLGFMDFNLQNWSVNNRLTEHVDFQACSFPSNRIPLYHGYTYDEDGYPVKEIIVYKSDNSNSPGYYSEVDFYYEE
jgi:hypothetical protein